MTSPVNNIRELNTLERSQARESAKQALAGKRPTKKVVKESEKYPADIVNFIRICVIIVLVAAFFTSAARLYMAGYNSFVDFAISVGQEWIAKVAGFLTIVIAEFGLMSCMLALSTNTSEASKRLLWFGSAICTAIALIGNITVANLANLNFIQYIFRYLDAVAPSVLALIMAYIIKQQFLDKVEAKYKAEIDFIRDDALWEEKRQNAEQDPKWNQYYATALKEKIEQVNRRLKLGKEALPELTYEDWLFLINREARADERFSTALGAVNTPRPIEATSSNNEPSYSNYTVKRNSENYTEEDDEKIAVYNGTTQIGYIQVDDNNTLNAVCTICDGWQGQGYTVDSSAKKALQKHWDKQHSRIGLPDQGLLDYQAKDKL